jgi:hypothetical protein
MIPVESLAEKIANSLLRKRELFLSIKEFDLLAMRIFFMA